MAGNKGDLAEIRVQQVAQSFRRKEETAGE